MLGFIKNRFLLIHMLYETQETTSDRVIVEKKPEYEHSEGGKLCLRCRDSAIEHADGYWCPSCCAPVDWREEEEE